MRWVLLLLVAACGDVAPTIEATVVAESRGPVTALAVDGDAVYWATCCYLATNVVWVQSNGSQQIVASTSLYVTSMAVIDGVVFLAGDGGTAIVGASPPYLVTRSHGTRVDVLEPATETIAMELLLPTDGAAAVGAGHVAVTSVTYDLVTHESAMLAVTWPSAVVPTSEGLAYIDLEGELFENDRDLGYVGAARTLAEVGDHIWALADGWLARADREGHIEHFSVDGPITASSATSTRLYFATARTIWAVD